MKEEVRPTAHRFMLKPEPLTQALRRLEAAGYVHTLRARAGRLHDLTDGLGYAPESLAIDETLRFEGATDPDEQVITFALSLAGHGPLGVYTVAYGPAMPAADADVVQRLGKTP